MNAPGWYLFDGFTQFFEKKYPVYIADLGEGLTVPVPALYERGFRDPFSLKSYDAVLFVPVSPGRDVPGRTAMIRIDVLIVNTAHRPEDLTMNQLLLCDAAANLLDANHRLGGLCENVTYQRPETLPGSLAAKNIAISIIRCDLHVHYETPMGME